MAKPVWRFYTSGGHGRFAMTNFYDCLQLVKVLSECGCSISGVSRNGQTSMAAKKVSG